MNRAFLREVRHLLLGIVVMIMATKLRNQWAFALQFIAGALLAFVSIVSLHRIKPPNEKEK